MKNQVSLAIIAGGKSSRFGSQKLLAEFNGKRLIDLAVNLAGSVSDRIFIVGSAEVQLPDVNIPIIEDLVPGCGPIGGIYTALAKAEREWVAVMPGDMPYLKSEIYQYLWAFSAQQQPVVAVSAKGIEPLVSIWPTSCASKLEQLIQQKRYKLRDALYICDAVKIKTTSFLRRDPDLFFNINYQSDIQR